MARPGKNKASKTTHIWDFKKTKMRRMKTNKDFKWDFKKTKMTVGAFQELDTKKAKCINLTPNYCPSMCSSMVRHLSSTQIIRDQFFVVVLKVGGCSSIYVDVWTNPNNCNEASTMMIWYICRRPKPLILEIPKLDGLNSQYSHWSDNSDKTKSQWNLTWLTLTFDHSV